MRAVERDLLLFILAVSAGSADAWSYSGLGHAFVANMTGNTVLLGLAVFKKNGDLLHPLISLTCYAAGVLSASFLTRKVDPGQLWAKAITWTLFVEGALMSVAEAGWWTMSSGQRSPLSTSMLREAFLGFVALAIGLQSGAMLQLKIPGIVTTYITGTWTTMMNGLIRFATNRKPQRPEQKLQFEERLWMQAGILAMYFVSAVLTGWFFRYMPRSVGILSTASVLLVASYGAIRFKAAD